MHEPRRTVRGMVRWLLVVTALCCGGAVSAAWPWRLGLVAAGCAVAWVALLRAAHAQSRLARISLVDPLTGLYNRRHLRWRLEQEVARAARHAGELAVCVLDLDDFKAFNDRYGHLEGDRRLRQVGRLLRQTLRRSDTAFRYGGEEFVLLLPQCGGGAARRAAERTLEAMRSSGVTASIGVADLAGTGPDATELLRCADAACLLAKAAGKNQVVLQRAVPGAVPAPP